MNDLGVQPVGLGEASDGSGEVADLAGVDDGKRQAGAGQCRSDGALEAAGGLQHDQGWHDRDQARDKLFQAFAVARNGEGLSRRAQTHVKTIL